MASTCRTSLTNCVAEYNEIASCDTARAAKMCFLDTQPVGPYDRRDGLQSVKGVTHGPIAVLPLAFGFPSAVIGLQELGAGVLYSLDY